MFKIKVVLCVVITYKINNKMETSTIIQIVILVCLLGLVIFVTLREIELRALVTADDIDDEKTVAAVAVNGAAITVIQGVNTTQDTALALLVDAPADIIANTATGVTNTATGVTNAATGVTNAAAITSNDTDIGTNLTNIGDNATDIGTNLTSIGDNATDIGTLTTTSGTHTTDIGDNNTLILANTTAHSNNTTLLNTTVTNTTPLTVYMSGTGATHAIAGDYVTTSIRVTGLTGNATITLPTSAPQSGNKIDISIGDLGGFSLTISRLDVADNIVIIGVAGNQQSVSSTTNDEFVHLAAFGANTWVFRPDTVVDWTPVAV